MQFILDYRAASLAGKLRPYGEVSFFDAGKRVYPAISGHPDIFIAKVHGQWILAPNTPAEIVTLFETLGIPFIFGEKEVGFRYPGTAGYNVFCDDDYAFISRHTDPVIVSSLKSKEIITVNQGYIACNLARIGQEFITSDAGIAKELEDREIEAYFVRPDRIRLAGVPNGFIGGTLGQFDNTVLYTGSRGSSSAASLLALCTSQNKEIVFLGTEEALDVGGIVVVKL